MLSRKENKDICDNPKEEINFNLANFLSILIPYLILIPISVIVQLSVQFFFQFNRRLFLHFYSTHKYIECSIVGFVVVKNEHVCLQIKNKSKTFWFVEQSSIKNFSCKLTKKTLFVFPGCTMFNFYHYYF